MCLSCACGKPEENHGDPRNITTSTLEQAAEAAGISREEVTQNLSSGMQGGYGQQGQNTQQMDTAQTAGQRQ